MRVLLVFPRWTSNYGIVGYFAKKQSSMPPLGLAILGAIAEEEGHTVKIIDAQVDDLSNEEVVKVAEKFQPDIIGLTGMTPFFHITEDLARKIKHYPMVQPRIVVGGSHITILREKAFSECFDYGFVGEAENSWREFLRGKSPTEIKGMLYHHQDGTTKFTGESERVEDLDSIPLPARHLLPMKKYKTGTLRGTKNFANIMFSRGCPYFCVYCHVGLFGYKPRLRSPKSMVDEMRSMKEEFGITHFFFADDNLTINYKWVMEFCDKLERQNLQITFDGATRANLVDEELIARMAEVGLIRLTFGLESVNPRIRKIIKKEVPLESYIEANRWCAKYGVECLNSTMIGLPTETEETVEELLDFLRNAKEVTQANCSIAIPYPGTELYEMAKRGDYGLKLLSEDFSQYRRYNSAVMQVGDLSPKDLLRLQDRAFVSIYSAPWRWKQLVHRSGIIGFLLTFSRLGKIIVGTLYSRIKKWVLVNI